MASTNGDLHRLDEPENPPLHLSGPSTDVQKILRGDPVRPPETLLQPSSYVPPVKPIETARYTSPAFHDQEIAKMWSKVWQYAGWVHDIPNPGDISVYRNVGQSVIVVRQRDGSIKAFRNSCLHRGRELCGESTSQQQLRCPYHAFTWSLDGSCKWIPAAWDFEHIDRATFSLPEVRVEQWDAFLFVTFDDNAPPLRDYLGAMVSQWEQSGWSYLDRYRAVTVIREINCNWKACLDAFIETLHVYASHPEAAYIIADTDTQYDIYPDEPHFSRFLNLVGDPSPNLEPVPTQQEVLDSYTAIYMPEVYGGPEGVLQEGENARFALARLARKTYAERLNVDLSDRPITEVLDAVEYSVFPNFIIWPCLSNPLGYRFLPGPTADSCIWETYLFLPFSGERPPSGPVIKMAPGERMENIAELGYVGPILQQDADNLEFMQAGMKSSASGELTLSRYQEARIRHYHEVLDRYLAAKD